LANPPSKKEWPQKGLFANFLGWVEQTPSQVKPSVENNPSSSQFSWAKERIVKIKNINVYLTISSK